jgi:DNA polymerase I-like protein with 3'-5' exonuclease and polymerase domains
MMDILYIDFETYYSKEYGFSKLTTEEYIRSEQFEVIGVAVKRNKEETVWFSGTKESTAKFLHGYDWAESIAVAHNAKFDMAILSWLFGIRPYRIADTLSMARAKHTIEVGGSLAALSEYYNLGDKGTEVLNALGKRRLDFTPTELAAYGEYCVQDVELTAKLFAKLAYNFPVFELDLIDLTIRMFTEPVLVLDTHVLQSHLQDLKTKSAELMSKVTQDPKLLRSNPQFAQLLREYGVEPPMKISPTTGKETYALAKTDDGFRQLLEHENEYVQMLAAARLGVKSTLEEARTERFIAIASRGKLPIPLRYYAAHTGRWGGDEKINMQNLPRGSALKKAVCAPEGYVFVDCDLSQIEARILAWLSQEDDLVAAFDRGDDVYKIMASSIYGKPVDQITKDERFVGKTTILGAGYSLGAVKFQAQLANFGVALDSNECERIIRVYRDTYSNIVGLWQEAGDALTAIMQNKTSTLGKPGVLDVAGLDGIRMPNGLYIRYPNLRKTKNDEGRFELVYDTKKGKTTVPNRIYGGKVVENICQALARIVIGEQLLRVSKKYKVVMTVHDAIGCIVPEHEAEEGLKYVENCMKVRPVWALTLPLDCEGGYARSYGEC